MFTHAHASVSTRTVQVIASFLSFYLTSSERYYTKVRNVIYGDYERAWPFHIKQDTGNSGQTLNSWRGVMTF